MSAWLVVAEGDFSFAAMKGDRKLCGYCQNTKLDWIATAAARISYAFDNSLIYLKGGGAEDHDNYGLQLNGISYFDKVTRLGLDDQRRLGIELRPALVG